MVHHFHRIKKIALAHQRVAVQSFHATHRHAKRLLRKHRMVLHKVRHHAVRSAIVAGVSMSVLAAPVLASAPNPSLPSPSNSDRELQQQMITDHVQAVGTSAVFPNGAFGPAREQASHKGELAQKMRNIAPSYTSVLTGQQEEQFTQVIQQYFGFTAKAELEGMRLNATQGIIAGEQHLPLYPGDSLANHGTDPTASLTGMVPGLPSWGYFAPDKASVTQKMIEQEEYYIAAQTWLSPGWTAQNNAWYKYRKMVMLAPDYENNRVSAVVVDIGDAGPSPFVYSNVEGERLNRTFGGSNEVLMGLNLGLKRVGHVYAFFIDDPQDKVPLGPLGEL